MNESLSKLLSASIKGYIDDIDEAERIVSALAKLTPSELDPKGDSCILQNIEIYLDIMERTDIDKEAVTCGEFIGILDSFANDPNADDKEERQLVIRRSLFNLLGALRDNSGDNAIVKLFKAVTVRSYFECLLRMAGKQETELFGLYQTFRLNFQSATDYSIKCKTTISDLFDEVVRQLNKRWDILSPIEEYKKGIEAVYDAIYCFFVECFRIGFPGCFKIIELAETEADDNFIESFTDDDLFKLDIDDFF